MDGTVPALFGLGLLAWRAMVVMHREHGQCPGAARGRARHGLQSEYTSGAHGGEAREYIVPKDPRDYARLFVPKDKHGR